MPIQPRGTAAPQSGYILLRTDGSCANRMDEILGSARLSHYNECNWTAQGEDVEMRNQPSQVYWPSTFRARRHGDSLSVHYAVFVRCRTCPVPVPPGL